MKFSFWRKDGIGNRYAVSTDPMNAVWAGGYVIRVAEGQWIIESDPSQRVYPTAEDAAEAMTAGKGDARQVSWTGAA
jgi:hypothetical protein